MSFEPARQDERSSQAETERHDPRREAARHTVLDPRRGSATERLGTRLRHLPPALAATLVALVGYVLLALLMIGLGLLLTHVLTKGAVGRWDTRVGIWFVDRRTTTLNTWTRVASDLGSTWLVVGVGLLSVLGLALARRWHGAWLIVAGLVIEFAVFLTTVLIVNRPRPALLRLDRAPPTSSFPSGHVAAAIVLFGTLAIIVGYLIRALVVRIIAWLLAILIPILVGLARVYRGMHHPTDVLASVLLGGGALVVAVTAVRVRVAVQRGRRAGSEPWNGRSAARS